MRNRGVKWGRHRYRMPLFLAIAILLFGGATTRQSPPIEGNDRTGREIEEKAMSWLRSGLLFERHLPVDKESLPPDAASLIYILGGGQESLESKYRTAGRLFAAGAAGKVLVLHRPGITEYSPALGRNFTNDEWSVLKLEEAGIPAGRLEFVTVPPAFLDTLAEARAVSSLARSRGVKRLVLVSSRHHMRRVWISFSHFDSDHAFDIYAYGSMERAGLVELLIEHLKLLVYRYAVLLLDPAY